MNRDEALALATEIADYGDDFTVVDFTWGDHHFGVVVEYQGEPLSPFFSRSSWLTFLEPYEALKDIREEWQRRRARP